MIKFFKIYDKSVKVGECVPEFCELSQQIISPEEGAVVTAPKPGSLAGPRPWTVRSVLTPGSYAGTEVNC